MSLLLLFSGGARVMQRPRALPTRVKASGSAGVKSARDGKHVVQSKSTKVRSG